MYVMRRSFEIIHIAVKHRKSLYRKKEDCNENDDEKLRYFKVFVALERKFRSKYEQNVNST